MTATATPTYDSAGYLGPNPHVTRLYDNVQAVLPDITIDLIKMQAWNTIEDFYLNTGYRRETIYWELEPGASIVDFNPYDGKFLVAWVAAVNGLTNYRIQPPARLIDMSPNPVALRTGQALLFLKPREMVSDTSSCGCDLEELWSNWFEVILHGTLARIFAIPMKPYSSPQLAATYFSQYFSGRGRARATAQAGFNQQARWRFPYFAGGKRKN